MTADESTRRFEQQPGDPMTADGSTRRPVLPWAAVCLVIGFLAMAAVAVEIAFSFGIFDWVKAEFAGSVLSAGGLIALMSILAGLVYSLFKRFSATSAEGGLASESERQAAQTSALAASIAFLFVSFCVAADALHVLHLSRGNGELAEALRVLWVGSLAATATAVVVLIGTYLTVFGHVASRVTEDFRTAARIAGEGADRLEKRTNETKKTVDDIIKRAVGRINTEVHSSVSNLKKESGRLSRTILASLTKGELDIRSPELPEDIAPLPLDGALNQFTAVVDAGDQGVHLANRSSAPTTNKYTRRVAGGILDAYLNESAFDLSQRRLVTSTANYAAVTVGAARSLEKLVRFEGNARRKDEPPVSSRVLYLTNTVCHPCHLLNWPWSVEAGAYPIRFSPDFILEYMTVMRLFAVDRGRYFHGRIVSVRGPDEGLKRAADSYRNIDCPMPPQMESLVGDWSDVFDPEKGFDTTVFDDVPSVRAVIPPELEVRSDEENNGDETDARLRYLWYLSKDRRAELANSKNMPDPFAWRLARKRLSLEYPNNVYGDAPPPVAACWNLGSGESGPPDMSSVEPGQQERPQCPCVCPSKGKEPLEPCLREARGWLKRAGLLGPSAKDSHGARFREGYEIEERLERIEAAWGSINWEAIGLREEKIDLASQVLDFCSLIDRVKWTVSPDVDHTTLCSSDLKAVQRCLLVGVNSVLASINREKKQFGAQDLIPWFADSFHSEPDAAAILCPERLDACYRDSNGEARQDGLSKEFAIVGVLKFRGQSSNDPGTEDIENALREFAKKPIPDDEIPEGKWVLQDVIWIEATAESPWRVAEISWKVGNESHSCHQLNSRELRLIETYADVLQTVVGWETAPNEWKSCVRRMGQRA